VAKMTDLLTELAIKYGTDRHPGYKHNYTPYYYDLFIDRRESIHKVLEIGVGEGPGLRMWRDFFPYARIYGIDNEPKRIFKEDRIDVFFGDQTSLESLNGIINIIGADIDFVVDDASHKPEDQIFTCLTLMPLFQKETIYIIEDVADLSIVKELTQYNLEIPALKRKRKRYDDYLIIVKKI
jgi:hypothetical protein